jgi:hypothetical protein
MYALSSVALWRAVLFFLKAHDRIRASFLGADIARLVEEELQRSLSSTEVFRNLVLVRAMKVLSGSSSVKGLIYRLEFQPFECALLYGVKGRTRAVAFQHSLFGRNYLPYFFVPGELSEKGAGGSDAWAMPLPDLVLTSGGFGREIMVRNGLASQAVVVCGPVRYSALRRYLLCQRDRVGLRASLGIPADATVLLVATAVSREEARGLFAALAETLPRDKEVRLIFKSHPALPMDAEFTRMVGERGGSASYHILTPGVEFYDVLAAADAVVLTSSTLALEAVVLGVLPIVFDSGAVFDPKAVEPDECGGLLVRNAEELGGAIRQVVTRDPGLNALRTRWPDLVSRWLDRFEPDPDTRFVEILREKGFLSEPAGLT